VTTRAVLVTIAIGLALTPAGCHKPATRATGTAAGTAPAGPVTPGPTDYRTFSVAQLEMLIRDKSGSPITLTAAGPNKYRGTRPSPDGTAQLPVEVTVEAERITIETRGGGLSSKEYITPRGYETENVR
jgi:hypothetical protein